MGLLDFRVQSYCVLGKYANILCKKDVYLWKNRNFARRKMR